MITTLKTEITVKDICEGFVYNELEGKGLFGLSGKLTIQPEYQRNYIYADGKKDAAVIESILNELKTYFNSVIDWASTVFIDVEREMCGLEWGRLYETYRKQPYSPQEVSNQVQKLYADPYIKNRKGIFEFILGNSTDTKLLDVRVFDEATKKSVYATQTAEAKGNR